MENENIRSTYNNIRKVEIVERDIHSQAYPSFEKTIRSSLHNFITAIKQSRNQQDIPVAITNYIAGIFHGLQLAGEEELGEDLKNFTKDLLLEYVETHDINIDNCVDN